MADRFAKLGVQGYIKKTEAVADGIFELGEQLPGYGKEIRTVVMKLYELKASLAAFDLQTQDPNIGRLSHEFSVGRVCKEVQKCLKTLDSLEDVFYRARNFRTSLNKSAEWLWKNILTAFVEFEHEDILSRLDTDKKTLDDAVIFLKNHNATRYSRKAESKPELPRLRSHKNLPQGHPEPPPLSAYWQRSEEKRARRPSVERHSSQARYAHAPSSPMQMQMPPTPPLYDSPPQRPYSTPVVQSSWQPPSPPNRYGRYAAPVSPMYDGRPMTPISPVSPTSQVPPQFYGRRYSNQSSPVTPYGNVSMPPSPTSPPARPKTRSSKSRPSQGPGKWWVEMLRPSPGATALPTPPQTSWCYGPPMENVDKDIDEEELLTFQLDSALRICLVQNQKTKKAKVVCTRGGEMWNGSRKATPDFQTVIEANRLAILREGSGIHLMKGTVLWARLYFGTYENMTLFKHAFLALRSQGPEAVYTSPSESFQEDVTQERVHFAGRIDDEGYVHMLRVTEDLQSGAVRMAAARISDHSDVTVWTAFITKQITQANFMSQDSHDVVTLRDLRRISFSSVFETHTYHKFPLRFKNPSDTVDFQNAIRSLASHHATPPKLYTSRRTSVPMTYQQDYFQVY